MLLRNRLLGGVAFGALRAAENDAGAPPVEGSDTAPIQAVEAGAPPPVAATPPAAQDDATPPADGELPLGDQPAEPKADWRDKEIKRKHAQLKAKEARETELLRENEELRALAERATRPAAEAPAASDAPPAPATPRAAAAPAVDPTAVRTEAERIVAQQNYDKDCATAYESGAKAYGKEWDTSIERLKDLGGFDTETMVGLLATDNPAKVLHELGKNPDQYHRIMELPPAKRLNEMAKIASTQPPKPKISEAPAPVEPVGGRSSPDSLELRDDLTDEEWNRRRDAQERQAWLRKTGKAA